MTPQRVIADRPWQQALAEQLSARGARRVVLATNTALLREGALAGRVVEALGPCCSEVVGGIRAHPPREDVLRLARALGDQRADAVIGVGGGSVTSAVKAARLALANGVREVEAFDVLIGRDGLRAPALPFLMLPTTLSAGEYTAVAGVRDLRTGRKEVVRHERLAPDLVILDPALARDTPPGLWFGTAVRSLDHVVETWCSPAASEATDACCLEALCDLLEGLRREDVLRCQQGARRAIRGIAAGVPQGASHGIGHALGGIAGVAHGDTSCILLPRVLRFNAAVNAARQARLAARWSDSGAALPELVEDLVRSYGLPRRLRETGIAAEILPAVAREAMASPWVQSNPRPLRHEGEVLELLRGAW